MDNECTGPTSTSNFRYVRGFTVSGMCGRACRSLTARSTSEAWSPDSPAGVEEPPAFAMPPSERQSTYRVVQCPSRVGHRPSRQLDGIVIHSHQPMSGDQVAVFVLHLAHRAATGASPEMHPIGGRVRLHLLSIPWVPDKTHGQRLPVVVQRTLLRPDGACSRPVEPTVSTLPSQVPGPR